MGPSFFTAQTPFEKGKSSKKDKIFQNNEWL